MIFVDEDELCLYDKDYSVVRITLNEIANNNEYLLEKLEDGTLTNHSISGLAIGDTIELCPCKFGFGFSNYTSVCWFNDSNYSGKVPRTTIDISEYNTSNITDFTCMFSFCDNIVGLENLNTSQGVTFKCMFYGAFSNAASGTTISIPLDFTNADINKVTSALAISPDGVILDLTGAKGPAGLTLDDLGITSEGGPTIKNNIIYGLGGSIVKINLSNESLLTLLITSIYNYQGRKKTYVTLLNESGTEIEFPGTYTEFFNIKHTYKKSTQ